MSFPRISQVRAFTVRGGGADYHEGMGGAMDLVAGVKRVVVVMEHANKAGEPKLLHRRSLPLTGKACVDLVITDLTVFTPDKGGTGGLTLLELAPAVTLDEVRAKTEAQLDATHIQPG